MYLICLTGQDDGSWQSGLLSAGFDAICDDPAFSPPLIGPCVRQA
jgi:hypothetical protein